MKIPYGKNELYITLLGLDDANISDEKMEELINELEKITSNGKNNLNKAVAEFHGISVEQLIASQNYKVLCDEYMDGIFRKMAVKIREKLNLTDKEAWALIAKGLGWLD